MTTMQILRLGYVVPRLVALVLVYLLAEVGSGYLLRWSVESGGSAAVGAKVDLVGAKVSLLDTQLRLDGRDIEGAADVIGQGVSRGMGAPVPLWRTARSHSAIDNRRGPKMLGSVASASMRAEGLSTP